MILTVEKVRDEIHRRLTSDPAYQVDDKRLGLSVVASRKQVIVKLGAKKVCKLAPHETPDYDAIAADCRQILKERAENRKRLFQMRKNKDDAFEYARSLGLPLEGSLNPPGSQGNKAQFNMKAWGNGTLVVHVFFPAEDRSKLQRFLQGLQELARN